VKSQEASKKTFVLFDWEFKNMKRIS